MYYVIQCEMYRSGMAPDRFLLRGTFPSREAALASLPADRPGLCHTILSASEADRRGL